MTPLKLYFQFNLGKPLETFVVLSYFNYFSYLFIANSWKNIFDCNCTSSWEPWIF